MSPAQMFEHGIARAGYIEAPRDSDLAYEFLKAEFRKVQHYGVDFGGRRYNGPSLNPYRNLTSPYTGKAKGPHQYGGVILPFTILRRLDCILERTRDEVRALAQKYAGGALDVQ